LKCRIVLFLFLVLVIESTESRTTTMDEEDFKIGRPGRFCPLDFWV
jgi:hypothetical protein